MMKLVPNNYLNNQICLNCISINCEVQLTEYIQKTITRYLQL